MTAKKSGGWIVDFPVPEWVGGVRVGKAHDGAVCVISLTVSIRALCRRFAGVCAFHEGEFAALDEARFRELIVDRLRTVILKLVKTMSSACSDLPDSRKQAAWAQIATLSAEMRDWCNYCLRDLGGLRVRREELTHACET